METDALIVARKIQMGRKLDTNEPEDDGFERAAMVVVWEGKRFMVRVTELGEDE